MAYEDNNCDSLTNLAILDPSRWGWSASGGIVDLLPPQEKARRKMARNDFKNQKVKEAKRLKKEKELARAKAKASEDGKATSTSITASASSSASTSIPAVIEAQSSTKGDISGAGATAVIDSSIPAVENSNVTTTCSASAAVKTISALSSTGIDNETKAGVTVDITKTGKVSQESEIGRSMELGSASIPPATSTDRGTSTNEPMVISPANVHADVIISNDGSSEIAKLQSQEQTLEPSAITPSRPAEVVDAKAKSATNTDTNPEQKALMRKSQENMILEKYGLSDTYKPIIKKRKGKSKRDRFDLEVISLREDGSVHPDAYHRGVVGEEARQKTGALLCDMKETDTNHGKDEDNLKVDVLIEFPIGEPDFSDDELEEGQVQQRLDGAQSRRNARRGGGKVFISETERRIKREARLASLPRFRDTVKWDLSNPKTPTPMLYATDVAAEFCLSFNRTLDLARSIQNQIDKFVRENVNYHVPISFKDPSQKPRGEDGLQPPKYSNPKLLYGGHCASDVTTILKPNETIETIKKETVAKASAPQKEVVTVNKTYEVEAADKLPKHEFDKIGVSQDIGEVFLSRAREENRAILKKLSDGRDIGKLQILKNHSCHFCHLARPEVLQFPCANGAHCYCDLHTSRRFGYRIADAKSLGIDYCPVCALECTCYRCKGRVATLLPEFAKECKVQGVGPVECKFDFVHNCSRNLARMAKTKHGVKKTTAQSVSTSTRRKAQVAQPTTVSSAGEVSVVVPKVPKEDFPAEMSSGINKDPSRKNDYNTRFTPEGNILCEEAVKIALEEEAALKLTTQVVYVDGNVDYCHECKKSGDLVCCDKCPRAFHGRCLTTDTKISLGRWECPRCYEESSETDADFMKGESHHQKLLDIFKQFSESSGFEAKVKIMSKIYDMIKYLMNYDFGDTFSEPVDVKLVRDYKKYVKRPMDLGTISARLLAGEYCNINKQQRKDLLGSENATEMDVIILNVMNDIEQIWHNCFLYNREGSSFHRMGQLLRQKSAMIRHASFNKDIDSFVIENLDKFVDECKLKREELSHSLKPWIRASKYQINVPFRGGPNKKNIGIFDPNTNMVIKQYTAFAAAYSVADFLTRLGHKSEIMTNDKQKVKEHINAMQGNPELTFFGYRWLFMDNVRSGNFKLHKSAFVIKKICQVSKSVLGQYETIDEAYRSWTDALSKSISVNPVNNSDRNIDHFKNCFLDGKNTIDQQEWVRSKPKISSDSVGNSVKLESMKTPKHDVLADSLRAENAMPLPTNLDNNPPTKIKTEDMDVDSESPAIAASNALQIRATCSDNSESQSSCESKIKKLKSSIDLSQDTKGNGIIQDNVFITKTEGQSEHIKASTGSASSANMEVGSATRGPSTSVVLSNDHEPLTLCKSTTEITNINTNPVKDENVNINKAVPTKVAGQIMSTSEARNKTHLANQASRETGQTMSTSEARNKTRVANQAFGKTPLRTDQCDPASVPAPRNTFVQGEDHVTVEVTPLGINNVSIANETFTNATLGMVPYAPISHSNNLAQSTAPIARRSPANQLANNGALGISPYSNNFVQSEAPVARRSPANHLANNGTLGTVPQINNFAQSAAPVARRSPANQVPHDGPLGTVPYAPAPHSNNFVQSAVSGTRRSPANQVPNNATLGMVPSYAPPPPHSNNFVQSAAPSLGMNNPSITHHYSNNATLGTVPYIPGHATQQNPANQMFTNVSYAPPPAPNSNNFVQTSGMNGASYASQSGMFGHMQTSSFVNNGMNQNGMHHTTQSTAGVNIGSTHTASALITGSSNGMAIEPPSRIQRRKSDDSPNTPGRSAAEVAMAASLLDFARGFGSPAVSESSLPAKKRPVHTIGSQHDPPDSKRRHNA